MYLDHRIVDCYVTKGNIHDSVPLIDRAEYIKNKYGFNIKELALDFGYATLDIKKYFEDNNIFGVIAYRSYHQGSTTIRKYKFIYNKEKDYYICPETGVILPYTGRIDRNGTNTIQIEQTIKIVQR